MKNIFLLIGFISIFFFLGGCQTKPTKDAPDFEDCIILSKSFYCKDVRLNDIRIDKILQRIDASRALNEEQKEELRNYFEVNRNTIIKNKDFELSFSYIGFFKGYSSTNAEDRNNMYQYTLRLAKKIEELQDQLGQCKGSDK